MPFSTLLLLCSLLISLFAGPDSPTWTPTTDDTWYYQLETYDDLHRRIESGTMPMRDIYVVDMDEISEQQIDLLQARGIRVVAYFSAGTMESWRADSSRFPKTVLGQPMEKFGNEFYLDISADTVLQLMNARIEEAARKGFDGIEPDNVDIAFSYTDSEAYHTERLGFDITAAQQLDYNKKLASLARENGLCIGLKNDREQIDSLVEYFDWSTNESMFSDPDSRGARGEPHLFIQAGKPVLAIEYRNNISSAQARTDICREARPYGYFVLFKKRTGKVDGWETLCPE